MDLENTNLKGGPNKQNYLLKKSFNSFDTVNKQNTLQGLGATFSNLF